MIREHGASPQALAAVRAEGNQMKTCVRCDDWNGIRLSPFCAAYCRSLSIDVDGSPVPDSQCVRFETQERTIRNNQSGIVRYIYGIVDVSAHSVEIKS